MPSHLHRERPGYTPQVHLRCFMRTLKPNRIQDRRRIEREAFSGQLLGIIATNALELGVDIGVLDVVIVLGIPPGGLASFVCRFPYSIYNLPDRHTATTNWTCRTTGQRLTRGFCSRRSADGRPLHDEPGGTAAGACCGYNSGFRESTHSRG